MEGTKDTWIKEVGPSLVYMDNAKQVYLYSTI